MDTFYFEIADFFLKNSYVLAILSVDHHISFNFLDNFFFLDKWLVCIHPERQQMLLQNEHDQ